MPTVSEILGTKPPLGVALAQGVQTLSANQEIDFSLYRRYVFPLDGLNYWIKIPSTTGSVTTAGTQLQPGLSSVVAVEKETVQISPGGFAAMQIIGGTITNPVEAEDQGLTIAEPLFVDFTGPAYHYVTGTTSELAPGESIEIPADCLNGAWVNALTSGHKFTVVLRQTVPEVTFPINVKVSGSFHYQSAILQQEDAIVDSNNVVFTALSEIQEFNQLGPDYLYIGDYDGITFAFSSRARLYEQADLYHYQGTALMSRMKTQIVDDPYNFNPQLLVSNSLPIWIGMPNYVPPYPGFTCDIPLFPSYLVTDNLIPPFGSVHIEDTTSVEMGPAYGPTLEQSQLCREKVRVHLYGVDNSGALDFVAFVQQYSRDWNKFGLSQLPAIKDAKTIQSEFKILAQHKIVEFDINYAQYVARDEFRQFIKHAIVQFYDPAWLVPGD
jgi:hypothetical protein